MKTFFFLLILFFSTLPILAKVWTSADGTKTFSAKFVSYNPKTNRVTVIRKFRKITFNANSLSWENRKWLKQRSSNNKNKKSSSLVKNSGVYAGLEFGDDRATVIKKLKKSKLVTLTMDEDLIARTGLNGIFRCNFKLAGQVYKLFFDWNEQERLREITLRSTSLPLSQYTTTIHQSWKEATQLFSHTYGPPIQDTPYPAINDTSRLGLLFTHLWHKEKKQTIMIGPGIKDSQCFLSIRFVNQLIEPNLKKNSNG